MPNIAELIQTGSTNLWLFIPTAILLGALHGLEPGHSKTMMASFIIAIRGTVGQAALLGLCAAISHSLIVWLLAALAIKFGNQYIAEQSEPYFMLFSGVVVLCVSLWMFLRTQKDIRLANEHHHHHEHDHDDHDHHHDHDEYQDDHERAHALEIAQNFQGRQVSTAQIAMFGLSGGLMPCPASVTILMICLHLKRVVLGVAMVSAFSFGLAISMISVGVIAAWGAQHISKRFGHLGDFARKMPFISVALMALVGLMMVIQGVSAL